MKNKFRKLSECIFAAGMFFAVSMMATGCGDFVADEYAGVTAEDDSAVIQTYEPTEEYQESSAQVPDQNGQEELTSSDYAYTTLNDDEKKIYDEISSAVADMGTDVKLSTLDPDTADKCFNCVMLDHPEYFYIDGYKTTSYTLAGQVTSLSFSGKYTMDSDERAKRQLAIDDYVNQCLAGVPTDSDDYAKVKYIYDYIITRTNYVSDSPDSQNICSVFINGESVCQGYTMATKYLLDKLGIPCTVVYGEANGGSHAWDLVNMDGICCYVDTTWGDASYRSVNDGSSFSRTNYSFLGADWDILSSTHTIDSIIKLPDCTSLAEYYFVREGKYFEHADFTKLKELFDKAYSDNEDVLTVKCADSEVYSVMKTELFTDGKVTDMIQSGDRVKYVADDSELTISFSL